MRHEGFWYDKYDTQNNFPFPQFHQNPQVTTEWLKKLIALEAKANVEYYRGWSECRLCGKQVGNREYRYKGWTWPEGYIHYLYLHNIRPSREFEEMVAVEG